MKKSIIIVFLFYFTGFIYQFLYIVYITTKRKREHDKLVREMKRKVAVVVKGYIKDDGNLLKTRKKR